MKQSLAIFVVAAGMTLAPAQEERAVRYAWSFPQGNLLSNWSFENQSDECLSQATPGLDIDCRFSAATALSGSRVMRASLTASQPPAPLYPHRTDYLRVIAGQTYFLSTGVHVQVGSLSALGKIRPAVEFLTEEKVPIDTVPLAAYGMKISDILGQWQTYADFFSVPANAAFARLSLVSFTETENCRLLFDNVLLSQDSSLVFVENRAYSDAAGNVEKDVLRDETNDVVRFTVYDRERRPVKRYVPAFGIRFLPPGGAGTGNLPLFTVGAQPPANAQVQDFSTLDSAYAALVAWAAARTESQMAGQDMRIVVVVDSSAPDLEPGVDLVPVLSSDSIPVGFTLDGIHRESQAYLDLLAAIAPPPPQPSPPPDSLVPSSFDHPEDVVAAGTFAGNYPGESHFFFETRYPDPGVTTLRESALPGNGYTLAQGKTDKGGWAFVADMALLQNPSPAPSDLEIHSSTLTESDPEPYLYAWSRDRQGSYAISYTTPEGLVEKSAVQKNGDWLTTSHAYDAFNRPVRTTSPEGKEVEITAFDGEGRAVEVQDPDRGVLQSTYDDRGRLRFVHNAANSYFSAVQYDLLDRVLGAAKVTDLGARTQANADNPEYPANGALEQGSVYDELTAEEFQARTGLLPGDIGLDLAWLKNTPGKVAMAYHRNGEATVPGLSAAEELVASFYAYDPRGRLAAKFHYVGPSPLGHRWHKIEYFYDQQDRLERRVVYKDTGSTVAQAVAYRYDSRGRVAKGVEDAGLNPKDSVVYAYDPLDRTTAVSLYQALAMSYEYDIQGKARVLEGDAGGQNVFAQYLGYEGLAHPQLPGSTPTTPARYDGKISSSLMKYSLGAQGAGAQPIEYRTYAYLPHGPLAETRRYQGSGLTGGTGEVDFSQLPFGSTPVQTLGYSYADDGGFNAQTIDNDTGSDNSLLYTYLSGSHQLGTVTKTEGSTSTTSAFSYDADGRLTVQTGPQAKSLSYDFLGMPVSITAGGITQHYFYGADNFRVATYTEEASAITGKKVYVYEEGLTVAKEIRDNGTSVQTRVHLYGRDELVGLMDEETGEKRLLVKDHLGSVVQVIDGSGNSQDETFFVDYGEQAKKVGTSDVLNPSEGWTGKEFDADIGLTYFGARFYDPLLGIWLTPDPEYEFSDPYSYVGGDPINLVDPLGLESRDYGPGGALYIVVYLDQAAGMPDRGGGDGGYSGQFALGGITGSSSDYTQVQREAMSFFQSQFVNNPSQYNLNSPGLGEDMQTLANAMAPNLLPGVPAGAAGSAVAKVAVARGAAKAATARAAAKAAIARASAKAAAEAAKKAAAEKAAATAARGASQTFKSFSEFKKAMGPAGPGKAWHHIVEQTPGNIAKFGNQSIHTTSNLTKLSHGAGTIHAKVSGYYSSIQPFTNGQTVRSWLSTQSYSQQFEFGIQTMKNFGWVP